MMLTETNISAWITKIKLGVFIITHVFMLFMNVAGSIC